MKLSVIVPTWNRRNNIVRTLICLQRQEIRDEQEVEIIVVDDNSTDETGVSILKNIAQNTKNLKYIYRNNRTVWNASIPRNLGARISRTDGDCLLFLDSDILLPPDRIQRYIDIWSEKQQPNRVLIGPYHFVNKDIETDHPLWYQNITDYSQDIRWQSFEEHSPDELNKGLGFALACFGGSLMIPRDLFFKAGGYDETMLSGVEDGDFGLTLWESGAVFSMDKGLLGWHQPHEIVPERTQFIQECVKRIDEKHGIDIIKETGEVYRKWGLDWEPPASWVGDANFQRKEDKDS